MRHPERYTAIRLLALLGLIGSVGFLGLSCSWQSDGETARPTATATDCIEAGAEETAVAFAGSLAGDLRQTAQAQLTLAAPMVPDSVCPTATAGPNMEKTMNAVLATLSADGQSQP